MAFVTPSDPFLRLALFTGLAVYLVAFLLVTTVAVLRYRIALQEKLVARLKAIWVPALLNTVEDIPFTPPALRARDRLSVMLLWLHYVESTRGLTRARLCDLGRRLGFDRFGHELLESGNLGNQLIALTTLGRMQDAGGWDALVRCADDGSPVISLLAVRALAQIDPSRAIPLIMNRLPLRPDWPVTRLAVLFRDLPHALVSTALLSELKNVDVAQAPRLLRLVEATRPAGLWQVLAPLLAESLPTAVLAAALRVTNDPRALGHVRNLARHRDWIVRTQAANVLGAIGETADTAILVEMLADPVWWVRYRAATALLKLPFLSRRLLQVVSRELGDQFARDILSQALSESDVNRS